MRRHQPDEGDRPCDRYRGAGPEGDADHNQQAGAVDVDAERSRRIFAQRERAEGAGVEREQNPAQQEEGGGDEQMIGAAVLERAKEPERDFKRRVGRRREVEDERDSGAGEAREREAGKQRDGQARAPSGNRDQPADRDERAGDAGERHRERGRSGEAVGDDERRANRRRLRRPEQRGLRQRIAQQALQGGAGEPERRADQQRQQRARQADAAHDDAGDSVAVDEARKRLARGQRSRPDHERDDGEQCDEDREHDDQTQVSRLGAHRVPPALLLQASGLPSNGFAALSASMRFAPLISAATLVLGLSTAAHADDPPRRVVSFNVCADQLVLALAEPGQIAALSPNAADPAISVLAKEARGFKQVGRTAETIAPLAPDLVLVGPWDRPLTQRMLHALGFRTVAVDLINDIDGALVQIREIAALLGHPEKGAALEAEIAAARARLAQTRHPDGATALLVSNGGYTVGPASLAS